jgi:peptide/nickel transport system ATP-binding protein
MALLEVENLTKLFALKGSLFQRQVNYVHAVEDVAFQIEKGESFGLAGESGCGKTTCGKLLIRLLEPTGGHIYFKGDDIAYLKGRDLKAFRKNVQMIFQDPYESLNPRFSIMDTIAEPLFIQDIGTPEEREELVAKALTTVDLNPPEDFLFRFPHELSGGQRQRVAVARALVINPEFIVADEPMSMLDVSIRAGVMNLLLELKERFNLTLVFVTHDLAVGRYMCNKIAIMYVGKVVELAETEELIKNPYHPYTKALLSAVPVPDPTEKRERIELRGRVPTPVNPPPGCRFAPRCDYAKDTCRQEDPLLLEVEHDHFVACPMRG